ncbi:MAG TPA: PH domain-containing protein, partial [Lapillicoccus sp.]|nr:PH domain-containing protein [Lapillicoccus sp.]
REVFASVLIGLLLLAVMIYVAWLTPDDTTGNWIQWIAVAIGVLIAVFLVVMPILRWLTTRYVVTTHRVLVRRGIVTKTGKDITLSKVTDVSFERTLLDRLTGSGTLRIESAGDSPDETFRAIPRSDRVQQVINRLIDEDANRRAQRMVNRAGFETNQEAADRVHDEEQRMHEEEERLAQERRAGQESGKESGNEPDHESHNESRNEPGKETTAPPTPEPER